jgi:hypothetical protein
MSAAGTVRRRWMAGVAGLCTVAALVSCGSAGPGRGGTAPTGGARSGDKGGAIDGDFRQRNMVISASCTLAAPGAGASVQVDGWDPQSWKRKAHAVFNLPSTVMIDQPDDDPPTHTGGIYDLCNAGRQGLKDSDLYGSEAEPADSVIVSRVRPIFDQDFHNIAVVIRDQGTKATHVGYLDRTGKLTDLTGQGDAFGSTPHEQNAVFAPDGASVWFKYPDPQSNSTAHIAYRSVSGEHKLVDQWRGDDNPLLTLNLVGTPVRGLLADAVHVSPDAHRMAAWANANGQIFGIPDHTGRLTNETARNPVSLLPKGPTTCSDVIGWTDSHTVLCSGENSGFSNDIFVTQNVDTPRAPTSASLLPSNDRKNFAQIISPDGKQFIFVSQQEDVKDFYVSATTPGSTPKKVERTGDFDLPDTAIMVDWR